MAAATTGWGPRGGKGGTRAFHGKHHRTLTAVCIQSTNSLSSATPWSCCRCRRASCSSGRTPHVRDRRAKFHGKLGTISAGLLVTNQGHHAPHIRTTVSRRTLVGRVHRETRKPQNPRSKRSGDVRRMRGQRIRGQPPVSSRRQNSRHDTDVFHAKRPYSTSRLSHSQECLSARSQEEMLPRQAPGPNDGIHSRLEETSGSKNAHVAGHGVGAGPPCWSSRRGFHVKPAMASARTRRRQVRPAGLLRTSAGPGGHASNQEDQRQAAYSPPPGGKFRRTGSGARRRP